MRNLWKEDVTEAVLELLGDVRAGYWTAVGTVGTPRVAEGEDKEAE